MREVSVVGVLVLVALVFYSLVAVSILDDIRDQMKGWEIAVESRGDAAAVSASCLSDTGGE